MNNSTCVNMEDSPVSGLLMSIYILVFILGMSINLVTLGPIVRQVCNHNVLGVYLLHLSLSDLLYIGTMPMWIAYFYNGHRWLLSDVSCRVAGFFFYSNMYISTYLLCCVSVDRCYTITYPMKARAVRRSRYAWVVCAAVTLVVMTIHFLMLSQDRSTAPLDRHQRCYESLPMSLMVSRFNVARVSLGFLLPLLLLTICYAQIFRKVQQSHGVDGQGKRKVRLLSVGVISIFLLCFAPYHCLLLVRSVARLRSEAADSCGFEQQLHVYFSGALALSSLNSMLDPVLYVLVSSSVKADMRPLCLRDETAKTETSVSMATTAPPRLRLMSC